MKTLKNAYKSAFLVGVADKQNQKFTEKKAHTKTCKY